MLGVGIFIGIQVYSLIQYVDNTNYSMSKFLNALKNEDYSVYFSPSKKGESFAKVFNDFNLIIQIFKRNKIEKEAQYKYFDYLLEQVNLGIITVKKEDLTADHPSEEILFQNRAARDILQQPHKYWHRIAERAPVFASKVLHLKDGGKDLVEIETINGKRQLSLETISVQLLNTPYLIISFQDIRSEIEQKEIEAWHNVIRILAHEMLNSFTPVSSLAGSVKTLTENENGEVITPKELSDEDVQDINVAVTTIKKRAEGLLDFVKDYRTISNVPMPHLSKVNLKNFLDTIQLLMKTSISDNKIAFEIDSIPKNATVKIDSKLMEQVFINLINNAIYALADTPNPTIRVGCTIQPDFTRILVMDNGPGIEESIIDKVFIPFYTTKKNGSGIGLSLSKSILKKHGGNMTVSSIVGEGTTFELILPN